MALKITDDCINCSSCEIECPVNAVYQKYKSSDVNKILFIDNSFYHKSFSSSLHYYINPYICNECEGFYETPRCNTVCPVECCLLEDEYYSNEIIKLKHNPVSLIKIGLN